MCFKGRRSCGRIDGFDSNNMSYITNVMFLPVFFLMFFSLFHSVAAFQTVPTFRNDTINPMNFNMHTYAVIPIYMNNMMLTTLYNDFYIQYS